MLDVSAKLNDISWSFRPKKCVLFRGKKGRRKKERKTERKKGSVRGWKITNYGYHVKGLFSPYLTPKMTAVLEA